MPSSSATSFALYPSDDTTEAPVDEGSFAAIAKASAALPTPQSAASLHQYTAPKVVRIPEELWIDSVQRDAGTFYIEDPLDRYEANQICSRDEVVDLHFQSSKTAPIVLDAVLEKAFANSPTGEIWIITGSGHHVAKGSHQKQGGQLLKLVGDYLMEKGWKYSIGKDQSGHHGALCVHGWW